MENISHIQLKITDKVTSPDILVISSQFLPQNSEISEYIYQRCRQEPERVVVLTSSCQADISFDKVQDFPVYRWDIPDYLRHSSLGRFCIPILNLFWSFVWAIKLYFRYHYRYIEWGHGYEFISLLCLSYLLPIRFFIYLHGHDIDNKKNIPGWRSLFNLTLKRAQGVICNSVSTRDTLHNYFPVETPTHIIHPVVYKEKFTMGMSPILLDDLRRRIRDRYSISSTAIAILSVGKLDKFQGLDKIIENLPLLLNWGYDVHHIICGKGLYESELKSLVNRLRLTQWVHFVGDVPDNDLAAYYVACDIFALLETRKQENFGIRYLEAGYFGKPVIASSLRNATEAVIHQSNGILINPNSGDEILQGFRELCENPQLREKLGRRGKILANKRSMHRWLYTPELLHSCLLV
ncbi:glycosyltransferase family 4 protein [Calothrix sp. 336/3]|uniref:glycosyltransferase family 4 protein n=1 Tax=Calothrix sp. 336/3 TaxID=1337936 RepID=UPI0004E290C4|nr:glycosyltransferase family 4 protein [Calothrix sp. 336/3]AKG20660.1 glycosyl transferase family 1 [Calothrix sp. 336/3]